MYMRTRYIYILSCVIGVIGIIACSEKKSSEFTPWGEPMEKQAINCGNNSFSFSDIQANGELIMLTTSGPDTYFDYHGQGMGTQYLLCEKFAQKIGVSLRVEVCKTKEEMINKLKKGEADIIACQMPRNEKGTLPCGYKNDAQKTSWVVEEKSKELADSINSWYKPEMLTSIKKEESLRYSSRSIHRHTYAPKLNAKAGVISKYDQLFMKYAPLARWDWRLLAAQCYQESCFDPKAYSWAGACGLMQIMPSTAAHLGLRIEDIYNPEENIYASVRYIVELNHYFQDVRNYRERQFYVLASYNGGYFHIRDAMSLAKKYGKNQYVWDDVAEFVIKLSQPQFYNDPVVKYGYIRGQETAGYVDMIRDRWTKYRGIATGYRGMENFNGFAPGGDIPHKAKRKNRFRL